MLAFIDRYSLHINCGGQQVTVGNRTFEADEDSAGQAKYIYQKGYWGTSNTGIFYMTNESSDLYTAKNVSILKNE